MTPSTPNPPIPSPGEARLKAALNDALRLDAARDRVGAAAALDAALDDLETVGAESDRAAATPGTRFRALLLRAELATDAGDLIGARGWLAEARQIRLPAEESEALSTESRRADDLETFLTHRGCAG